MITNHRSNRLAAKAHPRLGEHRLVFKARDHTESVDAGNISGTQDHLDTRLGLDPRGEIT